MYCTFVYHMIKKASCAIFFLETANARLLFTVLPDFVV